MRCPLCKNELYKSENSYKCTNNHSFDIAKEGYINLLLNHPNAGDNDKLVKGRINFLNKDYYLPLEESLERIIDDLKGNLSLKLLDLGCGTGYYTSKFASKYECYGVDISKDAVKYAAKHDKNTQYIVASNNNIPLNDDFCDIITHIFSPVFDFEDERVLKKDGYLIVVDPGEKHLIELKKLLYKNPYFNEENTHSYKNFKIINEIKLTYKIKINDIDAHNLIMMTPYFYKTKTDDILSLKIDDEMQLTIDFKISVFGPQK